MRKRLKLWQSKLKTAKAIFIYILGFSEIALSILNHYLLLREQWIMQGIYWLTLLIIPIAITGIFIWMYRDTKEELKAQRPKIELIPWHHPIRDKNDNTIGVERSYDMWITTWDCPKYKTLTLELSNLHYQNEKERSEVLLSPPITLLHLKNVKPNVYRKKDTFHFRSTTKKMIISNQYEIRLKKNIVYETDLKVSNDKSILDTKYYQIQLEQLPNLITDLTIQETEVYEAGRE